MVAQVTRGLAAVIDGPVDEFIPVPNRVEGRYHQRVQRIIIHATRGGQPLGREAEATIAWFRSPRTLVSLHALVTYGGRIVRFIPDEDMAHHSRYWDGASLGLVLEQPTADQPFSPVQLRRAAELTRHWCEKFSLEQSRAVIMGHDEIPPGVEDGKTDPGPMFPWSAFVALVNRREDALPGPAVRTIGSFAVEVPFLPMWDALGGRLGLPVGPAGVSADRMLQAFEHGLLVWDGARVHLLNYTGQG